MFVFDIALRGVLRAFGETVLVACIPQRIPEEFVYVKKLASRARDPT
jgi:hypothetical protein